MNKLLIAVVGPTGIGKTATAIQLAQHFQTEIISADSRQFFKEMTIGTAVPEPEELAAAPHHFIQHLSIDETYSVGHYERDAIRLLDALFKKHQRLILAGGSMLYVKAILEGLDHFPETKKGVRERLQSLLKNEGVTALQQLLKEKDPVYYDRVDLSNHQRVMRALEVCISSGKPFSSFHNQVKAARPFQSIKIGLKADRSIIYDRINRRVDLMVERGLVEEVEGLLSRKHTNALQTVGYRELFDYFEGRVSLEQAIEHVKTNTRRFAKRQLTWYRNDDEVLWFEYDTPIETIIAAINEKTTR